MATATVSSRASESGVKESYRWHSLPSIGSPVHGCHLVPMKVPLAASEDWRTGDWKSGGGSVEEGGLTIKQVTETCPGVVKIVSLVNLDRKVLFKGGPKMYTREEVAEEGLLWGQVSCKPLGHPDSEPYPSEEIIQQFFKEVVGGLVAVHCAHGLNRTGYLICRYLIQMCNVEPREAVARFNEARGFPMKRETLLYHLYNRGWERVEQETKPEWKAIKGVKEDLKEFEDVKEKEYMKEFEDVKERDDEAEMRQEE